jgi:hypothetical protein
MRAENLLGKRINETTSVPTELLGDWMCQDLRVRYHASGLYSLVIVSNYTIENESVLHLPDEDYNRVSGTGINGVWVTHFPDNEWLQMTLGEYGYYLYEWNDGLIGGGYYSATTDVLSIVENRASYSCVGNQITFTTADGSSTGTYSIVDDVLTILFPNYTMTCSRVVPWP